MAKKKYDEALGIAKRTVNEAIEALVLESFASLSEQEGHTKEALELYSRAHEKYAAAGEVFASARILERLADHAGETGTYSTALELYRQAHQSYTISGDWLGAARVKRPLELYVRSLLPWGFLIDLKSGKTHEVRGERITVGRDSPEFGVRNDLSLPNRFISRRHLVINHEGFQADDLRSTNGTAVNGMQLPYGTGSKLSAGDIITLGNQEALQFRTVKSTHPPPLTSVWGIFINGKERSYQYLTAPEYSLTIEGGKFSIEQNVPHTALLKLRHVNKKVEIYEVEDEWSLIFTQKESDYEYKAYSLPPGKWIDAIDLPSTYAKLSPNDGKVLEKGPSFQLIIMDSGK